MFDTREPVVAGTFYPANKEKLQRKVQQYLSRAVKNEIEGTLKGIIAPHAGYQFSGIVAGAAYTAGYQLVKHYRKNKEKITVFVLAPAHRSFISGVSMGAFSYYRTPLGKVPVNQEIVSEFLERGYHFYPEAHVSEHSLEVQIPFLQLTLKDNFSLVPILLGKVNEQNLAEELLSYLDENTFLVVSSDLSHYHAYQDANKLDHQSSQAILDLDIESFLKKGEACGSCGVVVAIMLAQKLGWEVELLDYRNSGDTAGDKKQVVGYGAYAFYIPK